MPVLLGKFVRTEHVRISTRLPSSSVSIINRTDMAVDELSNGYSGVFGLTEASPLLIHHDPSHTAVSTGTTPLLPSTAEVSSAPSTPEDVNPAPTKVGKIIALLILGVFIANADGSFVLATSTNISSSFHSLSSSNWLITSYTLAMSASQPLYGKLSSIYGRKPVLMVSYALFTLGCAICGVGQTMIQVIFGRVISGVGGAGMQALVSILITDLVPMREVARWRSYVNVAATTGRSLGGPFGGWLTDTVGWRWSFFGQCPLMLFAALLVAHKLPHIKTDLDQNDGGGSTSKLARIDFLGAALLATSTTTFLLFLQLINPSSLTFDSLRTPLILILLSLLALSLFIYVESIAPEPIFPLALLRKRDVWVSYTVMSTQVAAQVGMMYVVPIYFQVTARASASQAGSRLIPAVLGNTVGSLLAGVYIARTGHYKTPAILAGLLSSFAYVILLLRWHGKTNWWESLYILPGGFGMGVSQTAIFIGLNAGLQGEEVAIATGGLYLASSVGMVSGISLVSAVLRQSLKRLLDERVTGDGAKEIIDGALTDVEFVKDLKGKVRKVVVGCYVVSMNYANGVSLVFATLAFVFAIFLRQRRLS